MEFVCSDTAITFSIEKINTIVYELNAHVILGLLRLLNLLLVHIKLMCEY